MSQSNTFMEDVPLARLISRMYSKCLLCFLLNKRKKEWNKLNLK